MLIVPAGRRSRSSDRRPIAPTGEEMQPAVGAALAVWWNRVDLAGYAHNRRSNRFQHVFTRAWSRQ